MTPGLTEADKQRLKQIASAASDGDHPNRVDPPGTGTSVAAARCRVWRERHWGGESATTIADASDWARSTVKYHVRCDCAHEHPAGWRADGGDSDGE